MSVRLAGTFRHDHVRCKTFNIALAQVFAESNEDIPVSVISNSWNGDLVGWHMCEENDLGTRLSMVVACRKMPLGVGALGAIRCK